MVTATKLPVTTNVDAMKLAETMFGSSIKIVDATYAGDPSSAGIYTDGIATSPGVVPSDTGVILSTGKASSFTNSKGEANQTASKSFDSQGVDNDQDLNEIAGAKTYDAAIFKADFVPQGSVLTMQVTFSSEEYLEYVGSGFNDAVGVWVNGEKAQLTVGDGDISIDNINPTHNGNLYVDNAKDQFNTEMDGFTVTLTLKAKVNPGEVNTIKIGIADGGDAVYDSNLLIVADSIQTEVVAEDDSFTVGIDDKTIVNLTGNDLDASGGVLIITKINGVPVTEGSHITLPSGLEIVVNGDGTITVISDPNDAEGEVNFSYEVKNANGVTDVGFVKGEVVPCFVEGARIETDRGPVPVEQVEVGDLVLTLDHGYQPVRWHGRRQVASIGELGSIGIPPGVLGNLGALAVSPQHRLHVTGWRAELYCGEPEVLVKAIHLVKAGLLQQDQSGKPVTYHHLLFDRHQIILAEGLWSESYYPGPATMAGHDPGVQQEILDLFPELASDPDSGYGPAARPEASCSAVALLVA
ncbi:MAG: choice-of-anchor L domain-containing protein [Tabrizicola sp.]|nr:choice-of-anchor L domain-containing protein [Tabrizicola sp.]